MNATPRNALLLFGGLLSFGLIPVLYSRYRTKPKNWSVEQREQNRLSVVLREAASGACEDYEEAA